MTVPRYAAITVTYNPELPVLERQLASLAGAALVVVVDNASAAATVAALRGLVAPPRVLVAQERNEGLAAGLNAGARVALERAPGCEFLLFLDQDTEPGPDGAARLISAAAQLCAADPRVGLVGPLMVDAGTGLSYGVHRQAGWQWRRVYPGPADPPLSCASVNGSGMVVPAAVFRALGGFEEGLFIDHVDTEFSFRAAAAGYRLYTVPTARFLHRMGEDSLRFWLGRSRVWPYRSPLRHAYLFRNAVVLMRRPYVPRVWKAWAALKLAATVAVHGLADPRRVAQCRAMLAGCQAGLKGVGGDQPGLD